MAGTNPNTLAGYVYRWTNDPAKFTDTLTGFRSGVSDTLTAFGTMQSATGGWLSSDGAAQTFTAYTGGGNVGGPSPAYIGGAGLCAHRASTNGKAPNMTFTEGTVGNRITPNAFTIIMAIRSPLANASCSDYTTPGSIASTNTGLFLCNNNGSESCYAGVEYNKFPSLAASIATVPSSLTGTCRLGSGLELVAFSVNAGTLQIGVLRGGTATWTTATPGTFDSAAILYYTLGLTPTGARTWRGIYSDVTICKAGNTQANIESAMVFIRDALLAKTGETFVSPTVQLDMITDSIGGGYGTGNGETIVAHLDAELRSKGVFVNAQSIDGSDAQTWNDSTVMSNFFDAAPAYGTVGKRILLIHLGANALAPTAQVAATRLVHVNGIIAKWKARTGGSIVYIMSPLCRSKDAAPNTTETARLTYVAADKTATGITGYIDLGALAPDLVPVSTAVADVCFCGGSHYYQLSDNNQHPGTQIAGFTAGAWTKTTPANTITKTGAFTSYTWNSGDILVVTAGTGFSTSVPYLVGGKTDNNSITIVDISNNLLTYADTADVAGYIVKRREGLQLGGSLVFAGRQNGVDGLHLGPVGHLRAFIGMSKPTTSNTFPLQVGLASTGALVSPVRRDR